MKIYCQINLASSPILIDSIEDVYSFGFGNLDPIKNQIDEEVITDNIDTRKVLQRSH
ncbi:MAG: hypothetical protein R2774_12010 [Saprospiraceae bacterium]